MEMELQIGMLQLQAKEHRGKEGFFSRPFRGNVSLPVPSFWTSALQNCERIRFCCIKTPKRRGSRSKLVIDCLFIHGIYLSVTHLHVAWSEELAQILSLTGSLLSPELVLATVRPRPWDVYTRPR